MRRDKTSKVKRKRVAEGAATSVRIKVAPVTPAAGSAAGRHEQISFRVRAELKGAILDEARRRRMTVQTLILLALRDQGLPVIDSDLEDLRLGAPRGDRSADSGRSEPSIAHPARASSTPPACAGDLNVLTSLLAAALMRSGIGQPSNVVVTNCGCGSSERSVQPTKPRNL